MLIKQTLPRRGARTRELKPLTWQQLLEIGLGELNINPTDFYEYSMEEFVIELQGSRKKEVDVWRHTRALAYMTALPHLKKKISQEDFWPLPGDKKYGKTKVAAMTPEERKKALERLREKFNQN